MLRIADLVEAEVRSVPFLEKALAEGVINYSALARRLRPRIERALLRRVSDAAVMMALRRLAPRRRTSARARRAIGGEVTVRSGLVEFTFHNSASMRESHRRLLARLGRAPEAFVTFTQGVSESMLIVSASHEQAAREVFAHERLVAHLDDLSAVVIRLSPASVKTPGVYYGILKDLAWQNINVIDVVSTYTEFTLVLANRDVERAFAALRRLSAPS